MSITPKGMSIQEAYRLFREGKLIVNRKYQRKLVWSQSEKEKLIDSIMCGYPIPLILLASKPELHGHESYEILDGVQRLTALFDFIENRVQFNERFFDTNEFTRAKSIAQAGSFTPVTLEGNDFLNTDECAKFLDYQLAVTIYPAMKETEMIEVFGRINSQGRQLSNQERRQAGVINNFSELIRKISFEIRGDVSKNLLKLYEMPTISIDNHRNDMNYSIKADEIFWCKSGVLGKNEIRNGEDEEMIADVAASILLNKPFQKSLENFDNLYNENTDIHREILNALIRYDKDILYENIISTFSLLKSVIENTANEPNGFRKIVSGQHRNPVKNSFYSLFMAFYDLFIIHEMVPEDLDGIMKAINGLQQKLTSSAKYAKVEDRIKNIDLTKGLISRYFVKKEVKSLKHGPSLIIDFENSLRRSKLETSRYEFKQGILEMSASPKFNDKLVERILQTATAIANSAQCEDGYIYIGIADNEADAKRSKTIYGQDYLEAHGKFIVGIEREITRMNWDYDQYTKVFMDKIRNSEIEDQLKTQLLTQIDIVDYYGYSIIRIRVPKQNKLTFFGDNIYVRNNNDTQLITNHKEILALSESFK
ncbi:DUF262 domain-containing protein [Lysinibacillus sp. NPDC092081]|uniref:GmrSD restriction endonuclease domain-containing protein n=1 Tax=Lysinibacillus sp. NPDC092081 TaxID=3364131 RepID=UPI0037FC21A7